MHKIGACLQMDEDVLLDRYRDVLHTFTQLNPEFVSAACYHESILQIDF
jgi:hypothetical protein